MKRLHDTFRVTSRVLGSYGLMIRDEQKIVTAALRPFACTQQQVKGCFLSTLSETQRLLCDGAFVCIATYILSRQGYIFYGWIKEEGMYYIISQH